MFLSSGCKIKRQDHCLFSHILGCVFSLEEAMKNFLKMVIPVVVLVGLFVLANEVFSPNVVEGQKSITLEFYAIIDEESQMLGSTNVLSNDEEDLMLLGDVVDRINENEEQFTFELGGSKSDTYGRFIIGINEYVTEDMSVGPWWGYTSDTNQDCIDAGFCSGIDMLPVYDNDVFVFTFESGD